MGTGSAFFSILISFKKGSFGGSGAECVAVESSSSFAKKRLRFFFWSSSACFSCGGGVTMILGLLIRIRSLSLNSLLFLPKLGPLSVTTARCKAPLLGDKGDTLLAGRSDEHSFPLFLRCFCVIAVNSAINLCASPSRSRPSSHTFWGSGLCWGENNRKVDNYFWLRSSNLLGGT